MNLNRNALLQKAATAFRKGDLFAARLTCLELLGENPRDIGAIEILARVEFDDNNLDLALNHQRALVAAQPKSSHLRLILGSMYTKMGRHDDAIAELGECWRKNTDNADALFAYAHALSRSGDYEQAGTVLTEAEKGRAFNPGLVLLKAEVEAGRGRPEEAIRMLRDLQKRQPLESASLYTLGKAYEKIGDADQAMECYRSANESDRPPFHRDRFVAQIDRIRSTFTKEHLRRLPRASIDTTLPIIVAARPRSGTTLVTRILGSHPLAADGGENGILARIVRDINLTVGSTLMYPQVVQDIDQSDANTLGSIYMDASRQIAKNAIRVADKSMNNYFDLGLVQMILPQSRVIWCRRNPVDTCLACYSENFGQSHPYTRDLVDLGLTHAMYERLMEHWAEVLELQILRVEYESLVANPESITRRMLEFCGLPWSDRCLRYHEAGSSTPAGTPTLSYEQIRKPVYRTSVGRAKKFEKHLGPLIEALGPYAS